MWEKTFLGCSPLIVISKIIKGSVGCTKSLIREVSQQDNEKKIKKLIEINNWKKNLA